MTKINAIDANTAEIIELDIPTATEISSGFNTAPTNSPVVGQVKVVASGTAVRFTSVSTDLPSNTVFVTAPSENGAKVVIGASGVSYAVDGTGDGLVIAAGETAVVIVDNLSKLYLNGDQDDWVTYTAG